jgi:hypothetical protein
VQFMRDYISLGEVPGCELNKLNCTYLPHHAVLKDSTSTKLRVVFNASFRSADALSLNDNLMAGPTIQPELFAILLRFRTFKYVVNGDIAKMYRMIEIHPDRTDSINESFRSSISGLGTKRLTSTFNDIIYDSLLGYSHKRPLCTTHHTGKTTQTAVTPPETLVSSIPGA